MNNFDNVDESDVTYEYGRFFYVLFIHLIYYIVLGPFSVLVFWYYPGMYFLKNLSFTP